MAKPAFTKSKNYTSAARLFPSSHDPVLNERSNVSGSCAFFPSIGLPNLSLC